MLGVSDTYVTLELGEVKPVLNSFPTALELLCNALSSLLVSRLSCPVLFAVIPMSASDLYASQTTRIPGCSARF